MALHMTNEQQRQAPNLIKCQANATARALYAAIACVTEDDFHRARQHVNAAARLLKDAVKTTESLREAEHAANVARQVREARRAVLGDPHAEAA